MKFYVQCVGAGLAIGFGVMLAVGLRTIGVITINHRWSDFRRI